MLTNDGSGDTSDAGYNLIGFVRDFRVINSNTFQNVVVVTAQSQLYPVYFTWTMQAATFDSDQGGAKIAEKTQQVNAICAYNHVQGFRTENDQDASKVLYHYAVITVGTDDDLITDEVRWRMDHIGDSAVFGAIDADWKRLQAVGAV